MVDMKITKENLPYLLKAINILRMDNDMRKVTSYKVKPAYSIWSDDKDDFIKIMFNKEDLEAAEAALSQLDEDGFEEFVSGDVSFMDMMSASKYGLKIANTFLEAIFEE